MNESEQLKPKVPDIVTATLSNFEDRIAKYQKETGERLNTEIAWLDAFNNCSMVFSLLIPPSHTAYSVLEKIITKTKELHADNLLGEDKVKLLGMIEELKGAIKE